MNTAASIPAPARHELRRLRLLDRLHAQRTCALILLVAPAGFGKSTLAATYARESAGVACWLALQAGHRNPSTFFAQIAGALESAFGDEDLLPGLRLGLRDGAEGLALARMLATDLRAVDEHFVLVLDDFQVLAGAGVEPSIEALVRHLPDQGQVVITARDPPQVSATELLSNDRIFVLGPDDLRFTLEETVALRAVMGGDEGRDAQAEGWIAGILLGGAPRHLGVAGGAMLEDYVERQVMSRLRPRESTWLETLAVVETITPTIAERLIGDGPWVHRLAVLAQHCPFLVRTDAVGYRLHGLVRDTLIERLRRAGPGRSARAWSTARALATEGHDTAGIVRASQELGEVDHAVVLVRKAAYDAIRAGRWAVALDAIRLLPSSTRAFDAELLLAEAHALIQIGEPELAQHAAQAALDLGGRSGNPVIQSGALIELANIARYSGDLAAAEDWLTSAEYILSHSTLPRFDYRIRAGRAAGLRGVCHAVRGRMDEARTSLESAERVLTPLGESRELGVVTYNLGLACVRSGDYVEAQRALGSATLQWRVLGDRAQLASTQIVLGSLQLRLGEIESAGATLASALSAAHSTGALRLETHVLACIGAWHRASGRLGDASDSLDESLRIAHELAEREPLVEALRLRAEVAIMQGNLTLAVGLLERAQAEGQLLESSYQLGAVDRALGRLYLASGVPERAVQHFESALARAQQSSGPDEEIVSQYWLGSALLVCGRARPAELALRRALDRATEIGRLEILAGPAAEDLHLLRHGLQLGHDLAALSFVERLAITRQPWSASSEPPEHGDEDKPAVLPRVEVRLLGTFVVHRDGLVIDPGVRGAGRAHELFALLMLHPDGLSSREIFEHLWPAMPLERARHNLQMTVYLLRRLLGSRLVVRHARARYQLASGLVVWADLHVFDEVLQRARVASQEDARRLLQQAVDVYRGPLLAETGWDWVVPFRSAYSEKLIATLLRLADLLWAHDPAAADQLVERALTLEPENEDAFERLLDHARLRGDRLATLHIQRRYEDAMSRIGLRPNPRLVQSRRGKENESADPL